MSNAMTQRRAIARKALVVLIAVLAGCSGLKPAPTGPAATSAPAAPTPAPSAPAPLARTVAVHLFEWRWADIAQECEEVLGPKGYAAVQVSPPQEHVILPGQPWYQRYQPVSYKLESRSGTRAEFAEMVARCKKAGVSIYVDAVINHMSAADGAPGRGSAGTPYDPGQFDFPGVPYEQAHFHHCPAGTIRDWSNRSQIFTCKLLNLLDLATDTEPVRDRIAAYLQDLLDLGVAGFRIDAAKHTPPEDLAAIFSRLKGPFVADQEVVDLGEKEAVRASEYYKTGRVIEFRYAPLLAGAFRSGEFGRLHQLGQMGGLAPSEKAVVWVNNHDTQRTPMGGPVLTYKSGSLHTLATVFMLAWPYGHPQVMSSFEFRNNGHGPPAFADGRTRGIHNGESGCGAGWVCEHRQRAIANMAGFRNAAADSPVTDWWTGGIGQFAFARAGHGFVAINTGPVPFTRTLPTSLPPGVYCDVIHGELAIGGRSCAGPTVTVDREGRATITVDTRDAVAIHIRARLP